MPSSVLVCSSLPVELELALLSQVTILDRSFLRDRVKFGIIGDEGRGSVGGVKPLDKPGYGGWGGKAQFLSFR